MRFKHRMKFFLLSTKRLSSQKQQYLFLHISIPHLSHIPTSFCFSLYNLSLLLPPFLYSLIVSHSSSKVKSSRNEAILTCYRIKNISACGRIHVKLQEDNLFCKDIEILKIHSSSFNVHFSVLAVEFIEANFPMTGYPSSSQVKIMFRHDQVCLKR